MYHALRISLPLRRVIPVCKIRLLPVFLFHFLNAVHQRFIFRLRAASAVRKGIKPPRDLSYDLCVYVLRRALRTSSPRVVCQRFKVLPDVFLVLFCRLILPVCFFCLFIRLFAQCQRLLLRQLLPVKAALCQAVSLSVHVRVRVYRRSLRHQRHLLPRQRIGSPRSQRLKIRKLILVCLRLPQKLLRRGGVVLLQECFRLLRVLLQALCPLCPFRRDHRPRLLLLLYLGKQRLRLLLQSEHAGRHGKRPRVASSAAHRLLIGFDSALPSVQLVLQAHRLLLVQNVRVPCEVVSLLLHGLEHPAQLLRVCRRAASRPVLRAEIAVHPVKKSLHVRLHLAKAGRLHALSPFLLPRLRLSERRLRQVFVKGQWKLRFLSPSGHIFIKGLRQRPRCASRRIFVKSRWRRSALRPCVLHPRVSCQSFHASCLLTVSQSYSWFPVL